MRGSAFANVTLRIRARLVVPTAVMLQFGAIFAATVVVGLALPPIFVDKAATVRPSELTFHRNVRCTDPTLFALAELLNELLFFRRIYRHQVP